MWQNTSPNTVVHEFTVPSSTMYIYFPSDSLRLSLRTEIPISTFTNALLIEAEIGAKRLTYFEHDSKGKAAELTSSKIGWNQITSFILHLSNKMNWPNFIYAIRGKCEFVSPFHNQPAASNNISWMYGMQERSYSSQWSPTVVVLQCSESFSLIMSANLRGGPLLTKSSRWNCLLNDVGFLVTLSTEIQ